VAKAFDDFSLSLNYDEYKFNFLTNIVEKFFAVPSNHYYITVSKALKQGCKSKSTIRDIHL
jgi:hypothetical protein